MTLTHFYNQRKRGFTLTELAIVLGAVGIVMGAAWSVIGKVWDSYNYRKMNDEIMAVVTNIRDHFEPKQCIGFGPGCVANGDITANLDNDSFRLIPVGMRLTPNVAGGAIQHALGGAFTVDSLNAGRTFRITLAGLSQPNCMRLVMEFPVMMPELGVVRLEAPGGAYDPIEPRNPAGLSADFPILPTRAAVLCPLTNNTNVVSYDFRLHP